VTDCREYECEQRTDWGRGLTQVISAECWRARESLFPYCEATEFNLRAHDPGCATMYVPDTQHADRRMIGTAK